MISSFKRWHCEILTVSGNMRNIHEPKQSRCAGDSSSAYAGCAKELSTVVPRECPVCSVCFYHDPFYVTDVQELTLCSFDDSPENTARTATWFNSLVLEYHVRDTKCSPYKDPVHEYYVISQAVCIAQFANLFTLADTLCAGDYSGVSAEKDTSVPIWYDWKTFA